MKRKQPDTRFICPPDIMHKQLAADLDAKVIGSKTGHLWEQTELPAYLRKIGNPPLVNPGNTAPLLYKNNYITIHDLAFYHHPEWNSRAFAAWYGFMVPFIAKRARGIFTVSNTVKTELTQSYGLPAEKISITYNGLSANMLHGNSRQTNKEKLILTVGTFSPRKNQIALVRAFRSISDKQGYKLMIAGDKNNIFKDPRLEAELNNSEDIIIISGVTEDKLADLYRRADIYASLSLYEGFGIPVLEAQQHGCKILCSDIPVYRELFASFADFCDPMNEGLIANALETLMTSFGEQNERQLSPELTSTYSYSNAADVILKSISKGGLASR